MRATANRYILKPDVKPVENDLSADQILDALHIYGDSDEESQKRRERVPPDALTEHSTRTKVGRIAR